MAVDIKVWWQQWRFGFALSGILVVSEIIDLVLTVQQTPAGMRWLGDLTFNAVDYPVYFSYLRQGGASWLVKLLYNDLGSIVRFEPFWSTFGRLTRLGLSSIIVHESARWLMTLVLGLSIFAVTRSLYTDKGRAKLAALIVTSGLGTGWIFALASNLAQRNILVPTPPDVSTHFSAIPILFGGAHMILSLALQFLIARWTWFLLKHGEKKYLWADLATVFLLASFHPYYIPLIGLIAIISLGAGWRKDAWRTRLLWFLGVCLCLVPSTIYNYWLTRQNQALSDLYFRINVLPLDGWPYWLMSLSGIILAAVFMIAKRIPRDYYWDVKPTWAWVWLISALICMALPFPWTAKYTQGLLPVLAILTLPFWLWVWNSCLRRGEKTKTIIWLCGTLVLSAPLLYYSFVALSLGESGIKTLFYQPIAVFEAWRYLEKNAPPQAIVISDDMNVNLWTPAYALRTVWIGHGHGTPDYEDRQQEWMAWLQTDDAETYNRFLDSHRISFVLTTNRPNTRQAADLLQDTWDNVFSENDVKLWERKRK